MFGLRRGEPWGWIAASALLALLVAAPVLALLVIASGSSGTLWPHLFAYVLPVALKDTALLLLGVGIVVASVYVLVNLVVDVAYGLLDPRIRVGD